MRDPEFIHGKFSAHATLMSVCADEMVAALKVVVKQHLANKAKTGGRSWVSW